MIAGHLLDLLAQGGALLACGIVLWRAEPALNRMSRCTSRLLYVAFCLIASAALLAVGDIVFAGVVPPWQAVVGAAGVALLLCCERRIKVLLRTNEKGGRDGHAGAAH